MISIKTKSPTNQKQSFVQDSVITSLCYLYQEAVKENCQELAQIIQTAIESCEGLEIKGTTHSKGCGDMLKQFYVLREFQKLDDLQKELFIREVEFIQANYNSKTCKH